MPLYVPFQLPDAATPVGARVARQLHHDLFVWFTTIDEHGTPQSLPVTFLWDQAQSTFLIYRKWERRAPDLQSGDEWPPAGALAWAFFVW